MSESPSLAPTFAELEISTEKSVIGKGTFGIVKMAESLKTKAKYALKIVRKKNYRFSEIIDNKTKKLRWTPKIFKRMTFIAWKGRWKSIEKSTIQTL